MAAVASSATDLFGDPIEDHPTWFSPSAFSSPSSDFSPSSYIASLRSYVPLETLAAELRSHLTSLNSDLIDLVNENYADFVGLGNRLASAGDAAARIREPIGELRAKVAGLTSAVEAQLVELKAGMGRRAAAASARELLERMLDTFHVVSKVEKLIKELPTAPADLPKTEISSSEQSSELNNGNFPNTESGASTRITQSILLERIASEMNRLKFLIGDEKNLPFIENLEKRIQSATSQLDASLEICFTQALKNKNNSAIYNCLRAYAAIDNTSAAEGLFRKTVISPLIEEIIGNNNKNEMEGLFGDELEGDYEKIKECVEKDCKFILDLCSSANSGLHVFDFLANSILKEVLFAIQKGKPGAFSPGKPTEFLKNYKSSLAFLAFLEGFCTTKSAVVKFRSEAVYSDFVKQWNVGVYFSLRFQEIAGGLDASLTGPICPVETENKNKNKNKNLVLKQSEKLLESLQTCWSDDVIVFSHCDKFLRLSLQLLARYATWLNSGLTARKARTGDSDWALDAPVEDFVYVIHDINILVKQISGEFLGQINQLLNSCSDEVINLVRNSILQAGNSINEIIPIILDVMIESIVEKSVEDLRQLKGITATYRMTNKLPVRHSPYVSGILRPLKVFLEGDRATYLNKDTTQNLLIGSAEKITTRYYELTSDLVNVARKTESSLLRLRQGRRVGASSDASDNNISDTEKICMQLFLDIQEYGRNLEAIGIKAADIASYRSLWRCVAPEEKQSTIVF